MNIKVNQSDFSQVLGSAIKAVPNKPMLPALENYLLRAKDGILTVIATDTNITVISSCECQGDGEACIPARMLTDIVRNLPDCEVELSTEGTSATIDYIFGHSELPCLPTQDFPEVGNVPDGGVTIEAVSLKKGLKHTLPCVSNDPLRPVMNGVYFHFKDGIFNLVASDSHVLAVCPVEIKDGQPEESFVVPATALSFLKDNAEGEIRVATDSNAIYFSSEGFSIQCRKVEGKFPNYAAVIPTGCDKTLKGGISTLLGAIRRVSVCANKASNHVKLTLGYGVVIEASDLGFNTSAKETIGGCEYEGDEMLIGFKADYLAKVLSVQDSDNVTISFSSPVKAALVDSGDGSKAIVMPVQI